VNLPAYLDRIGYTAPAEPTLETLHNLHRAHLFAVPFENLDIALGRTIICDENTFIRKIVEGREFLIRPTYDEKVEDYIRPLFQQYYTMSFDNYPVEMERLERPEIRPCK